MRDISRKRLRCILHGKKRDKARIRSCAKFLSEGSQRFLSEGSERESAALRAMQLRVKIAVSRRGDLHESLQNANMSDVFYRRRLVKSCAPAIKTFALRHFKGSPEMIDAERNEIV